MQFDLMILCHSLREDENEMLANLAHQRRPPIKVLALGPRTDAAQKKAWADEQIGVDAGPFGLLMKSAKMVNYRIKSKAKPNYERVTTAGARSNAA